MKNLVKTIKFRNRQINVVIIITLNQISTYRDDIRYLSTFTSAQCVGTYNYGEYINAWSDVPLILQA